MDFDWLKLKNISNKKIFLGNSIRIIEPFSANRISGSTTRVLKGKALKF